MQFLSGNLAKGKNSAPFGLLLGGVCGTWEPVCSKQEEGKLVGGQVVIQESVHRSSAWFWNSLLLLLLKLLFGMQEAS